MEEWIEVKGPTVDVAVEVAMAELGVTDPALVEVEVLEEPDKGFLGIGRKDAVVRVKRKPAQRRRRRRGKGGDAERGERPGQTAPAGKTGRPQSGAKQSSDRGGARGRNPRSQERNGQSKGRGNGETSSGSKTPNRPPARVSGQEPRRSQRESRAEDGAVNEQASQEVDIAQQAEVAREFLEGLLDAFGLEGTVDVRVEDDVILIDVNGEQTEALIGDKAMIMYAIHELVRTVVQRKTMAGARVRLDIGGYAARRREALAVYAERLAAKVKAEGGEIMLEPMNAADRKVVHDTIAGIEGVATYSEGEDPRRSVVITLAKDE